MMILFIPIKWLAVKLFDSFKLNSFFNRSVPQEKSGTFIAAMINERYL